MSQVLKRGCLARRMQYGLGAENAQLKLPRQAVFRQVPDFHERIGLDIVSLPYWGNAESEHCVMGPCFK